ncbi:MAG: hypothetical protein K0B11_02830 [Mariniphaga sp.]|nr:hypothetical protein [Mariniphaga sp.]
MSIDKTNNLIEWLENNQSDRNYNIMDVKEILSIAMMELSEHNDKTFESLPQAYIDDIIKLQKETGKYYQLDNQIKRFKGRFTN